MSDTRIKILDTAERLFGEEGYQPVSLRHITAAAGVNLAAIHYHFGSKEELLDELVMRKAVPVNAERLESLRRLREAAGPEAIAVGLSMSKTIFWASALCAVAAVPMLADQWSKSFSVGAAPELRIETSDANV